MKFYQIHFYYKDRAVFQVPATSPEEALQKLRAHMDVSGMKGFVHISTEEVPDPDPQETIPPNEVN